MLELLSSYWFFRYCLAIPTTGLFRDKEVSVPEVHKRIVAIGSPKSGLEQPL
jgi:hypothetical protein